MGQKKKKYSQNIAGSSTITVKKKRIAKAKSRRAGGSTKKSTRGKGRSSR